MKQTEIRLRKQLEVSLKKGLITKRKYNEEIKWLVKYKQIPTQKTS
jgi:hypothetical protein